jgi:hypothetical protein
MIHPKIYVIGFITLFFAIQVFGRTQNPDTSDYYSSGHIRYADHIYKPNIKSILLYKLGFRLSDPIIQLNTGDKLQLEFDDVQGSMKDYYYTFTHCSALWVPSEIWANEYLDGLMEDHIEKYEFSFNTRQTYTHYSVTFPNEHISIKLSGNYILRVYTRDEDGEEELAFTRRFMVFDPKVTLEAVVQRATTLEEYETSQEIDFGILTSGYRIDSPYQDLQVTILQNNRWDNALTNLKPFMVKGDYLDYAYDNGTNQFQGGNEFRNFDIKSVRYNSEKVRVIGIEDGTYSVNLWESERRTFKVYINEADIDGRFLLETEDETSIETMGEYVKVHFFLSYSAPLAHGALYVSGLFNGWQYTPENKMSYNFERHGFEATILLKQGYYNYVYMLLPNNSDVGDITYIEGSHSETENNYTILVYHHDRGSLYDQLIAVGSYNSTKK